MEFVSNLFNSAAFMPHGHCYLWRPEILWLNVGSDALIGAAYFVIPLFLIYLVKKRKDLAFNWIFVMFALFIVACGTTHLFEIVTVWNPQYGMQGMIKLMTAGVSLATAFALWPLMPKALSLPSVNEFREKSIKLLELNDQLKRLNASLEQRVEERTLDVSRLAAIVQSSSDAIIGKDIHGTITSWNPGAEKLFGYTSLEAIGMPIRRFVRLGDQDEYEQVMNNVNHGEVVVFDHAVWIAKDDEPRNVSVTISPHKDPSGKVIGSSSILRDITARLNAQRALQSNEEKFRRVIESAPNGLLMVNNDGNVTLCNSEIERQFGYTKDELIGLKIETLLPERFRQRHPNYRVQFFARPETRQMGSGRDLFGLRKDGQEFPVEVGLNPLNTMEGDFVLASVVDISKRKALEEHMRQVSQAIQEKNHEMEQFVYTVSHDLKAPLVTSTGFLGLLKEDIQECNREKLMDSVLRLERANTRMGELIDDLLQLSRIGRIKIEFQPVDVGEVVKKIGENMDNEFKAQRVRLTLQTDMPVIEADSRRIYQVFENLIVNALKYGCDGHEPEISVGYRKVPSGHQFFVKDCGPGIAPEYHEKIFDLFQRLENDNRGTGVGLTIVARIMQLHGGRVWVESSVGNGATFWLEFPGSSQRSQRSNKIDQDT